MKYFLFVIISLWLTCGSAMAHPCDNYEPNPIHPGYGTESYGYSEDWGIGDVTFMHPYPDASSLSNREIYMLQGANAPQEWGLYQTWYSLVFDIAENYYARHGMLPARLSESMIDEALGGPQPSEVYEVYKSPIHGDYPRLNAKEFSPGDLFIKQLDAGEKSHLASKWNRWDQMWNYGYFTEADNSTHNIKMLTEVYYLRMYGYTDTIKTHIMFYSTDQ